MLRFLFKKGKNRGFSLAELLAVVAILGILAAIAIPSAVKIQRDLKMLELNDTARQIFIAAQNQLTGLRAADGRNALPAPTNQLVLDAEDGNSIYYVTEDDGQFSELLPAGAIDSTLFGGGKQAVIEYNPQSSSVYAVFYAEKAFTYTETGMPRDTDEGKTKRREMLLGYYGGDAAGIPTIDVIEKPDITIENKEELKLLIDHTEALAKTTQENYADIVSKLSYTITLTQAGKEDTGKNQVSFRYDPAPGATASNDSEISWSDNGKKVEMVLDSLKGPHFAALVSKDENYAIEPGADITVSVQIDYTLVEDTIEKHSVPYEWKSIEVNSLFAARKEETVEGKARSIYQVAYGRHLQNLEERISGLGVKANSEISVQYVEQTRDIDWSYYSETGITAYDSNWSIGSDGKPKPPEILKTGAFLSITNDKIKSFDGKKREIKNLRLIENNDRKPNDYKAGQSVGLFGQFEGASPTDRASLTDIYLVNPYAQGSDFTGNIGTLAGYVENVSIRNCRAYLGEKERKDGFSQTNPPGAHSKSTASVGGLIGIAKAASFEQCFAALPAVKSDEYGGIIGGLVGQIYKSEAKSSFNKCYADTLDLSGTNVGGFIGACVGGVNIQNCYSVGTITNATSAAGFCTQISQGDVTDCYAAVTLPVDSTLEQRKAMSGFSNASNTSAKYSGCYYLTNALGSTEEAKPTITNAAQPVSYADLKKFASTFGGYEKNESGESVRIWNNSDSDTTKAYTMKPFGDIQPTQTQQKVEQSLYSDTEYPFPRLAAFDHYGDWPLPAKLGALVYYEVYPNGGIGIAGLQSDGTEYKTEHPIQRNGKMVVQDGYAIAGSMEKAELGFEGTTSTITVNKDETLSAKAGVNMCPIPYKDLSGQTLHAQVYYRQLTLNNVKTKLLFNPHFAETVTVWEDTSKGLPVLQEPVKIRSARQLSALGQFWTENKIGDTKYKDDGQLQFRQELDIDFKKYKEYNAEYAPDLTVYPIGDKTAPFSATYDGGCHTIWTEGFSGSQTHVGLFGYSTGTLENIVLRSTAGSKISGGEETKYLGALAGYASGEVYNCAVSGFEINGITVGGLVGECAGAKVRNSSAASIRLGGDYIGGLVGKLSSNEINSCYAVGTLAGNQVAAGIAAIVEENAEKIDHCYSACTIENQSASKYGIAPKKVDGCYYLKGSIQVTAVDGAAVQSYEQLQELKLTAFEKAEYTYPDTRNDPPYPFPAVVKDASGAFVHYGDWPGKKEEPDEPDEPEEFGELTIGVAVQEPDGKSFKIWGVDEDGVWSNKVLETVKPQREEYTEHVLICIPQKGNGHEKHDWYIWNTQLASESPKVLDGFDKYNGMSSSDYKFFTGYNLPTWGKTQYFYDKQTSEKGLGEIPPSGWIFSITVSETNRVPVFEKNSNR